MRTIVLTGTYSSLNKGDAAMQLTMAQQVADMLPDIEPVIGCPFPDRDRGFYAPFRVVRSSRRLLPLALVHVALLLVARLLRIHLRAYPLNAEIDAMTRADCVVDLSGDMLTEDYGLLVALSHLMPLCQALALGRPLVVCAQSIGPYRRLAWLVRRLFARAAAVTARERITLDYLRTLGPMNARLTADLAFLLPPAGAERLAEIAIAEGIDRIERPVLGVSVSALLGNRRNRHLPEAGADLLEAFARALDEIAERHGLHLLLVSHVVGPGPAADDREVSARLASRLRAPNTVLRGDYRPGEIKGLIARCVAFVGCRMHANIAALDSGVPTLAISYSHKTQGIMGELGLGEWVLPVATLGHERLAGELDRLLAKRADYRATLAEALPPLRRRALDNIDQVRQAMRDTGGGR